MRILTPSLEGLKPESSSPYPFFLGNPGNVGNKLLCRPPNRAVRQQWFPPKTGENLIERRQPQHRVHQPSRHDASDLQLDAAQARGHRILAVRYRVRVGSRDRRLCRPWNCDANSGARPGCGKPHVQFDEWGWETERCRMAQATAPMLDSTQPTILDRDSSTAVSGLECYKVTLTALGQGRTCGKS